MNSKIEEKRESIHTFAQLTQWVEEGDKFESGVQNDYFPFWYEFFSIKIFTWTQSYPHIISTRQRLLAALI